MARMTTEGAPCALFMQRQFAHYREPLIRELLRDSGVRWKFAHDPALIASGSDDLIKAITWPDAADVLALRYVEKGGIGWQRGAYRAMRASGANVVILPGDVRILSNVYVMIRSRLSRRHRPRFILWTHGWTRKDGRGVRLLKRMFYGTSDGLLLYSDRAELLARAQGFRSIPMHRMYNSVCDFPVALDWPAGGPSADRLELICVSRITVDRELDDVIRAMRVLGDNGNDVRLTLVGAGADRPRLEALAHQLAVDVDFHGPEYDKDALDSLYSRSHMAVIPGRAGLAVVQALARGVPVVAHSDLDNQMPEVEAIVPGTTGLLYERNCPESLASVIQAVRSLQEQGKIESRRLVEITRARYSPQSQARAIVRAVKSTLS